MTRTNRMLSVWYDLATQEQEILIRIATRLRTGQHTYGALELETDRRDWCVEAGEELLDFLVYRECGRMKGEG